MVYGKIGTDCEIQEYSHLPEEIYNGLGFRDHEDEEKPQQGWMNLDTAFGT